MRYIDRSLGIQEKIQYEVELHWINFLYWWVMTFVCGYLTFDIAINQRGGLFILGTFLLLCYSVYGFLSLFMTERIITNKRVVYKEGIISIHTDELKNDKLEGIEVRQTVLGRIFDYGDIIFSGIGASKVIFRNIDDPIEIKKKMDELLYDKKSMKWNSI